jgi:hypothetical protein
MANYRTARALLGKANSAATRVKERPGFPVTDCGANGRAFQEQRKEGRQEVRGEEGETKEGTA